MSPILKLFGVMPSNYIIERIGSGHIHQTFRLTGKNNFVLQRVNKDVFKEPDAIASNIRIASEFLRIHFPEYSFLTCIQSASGKDMEYDAEGYPWRLFPFTPNTVTMDYVSTPQQAYGAAAEFGRLTRYLDRVEVGRFKETIPRFHDLVLRQQQFEEALKVRGNSAAEACITACKRAYPLVGTYKQLIAGRSLRLRIVHNDTKINNVLFDKTTGETAGVIDLDTLMPGYFIYDLGDMVRTFVCPVSEEEKDLSKIIFRKDVYDALLAGYLSEMNDVLSPAERSAIPFAGKMMTYIMALRFLADYLRGNTYYHITYPEQNLVRAANQLRLLEVISENIPG
ncbi:MAG: aminoglycoside phosphotransferase family protein [Cytophagales bacterium]|nr:aminoglycoside phosphotransferase family protein [Cytophagales bacterium]